MGAISLGPVTDTEIKLTKEVLNAVVNATWTFRCSREFKRGQVESIRIGSVEKVGVEPDPNRVGPASWNLEYG